MNQTDLEKFICSQCDKAKKCNKDFIVIDENGINRCEHWNKLLKYNKYRLANIPEEFWDFGINDIEKDFDKSILKQVKFFNDNLKSCLINKVQFWFTGTNGNGKTTIAILMLKTILDNGYKGKVIDGFELVNCFLNNNDEKSSYYNMMNELEELDFIVVEEFDKLKGGTIDHFCNVINNFMKKKSIILTDNKNHLQLQEAKYAEFFLDRLHSFTKIVFKGSSYRKKQKSKFEILMEEND